MAIIIKNHVSIKCKSFADRYKDHEASDLLEEASKLIDDLEDQIEDLTERLAWHA